MSQKLFMLADLTLTEKTKTKLIIWNRNQGMKKTKSNSKTVEPFSNYNFNVYNYELHKINSKENVMNF